MIKKILFCLCLTQFSYASDHLEPEESQFSGEFMEDYTHQVLSYLSAAYNEDVLVRLIGFPSFSPEYALWIQENKKGQYQIAYESPEKQLWGYQMMLLMERSATQVINKDGKFVKDEDGLKELKSKYPENPSDIPRESCKKKIEADLAGKIIYVWTEMLMNTRYSPEPSVGIDGESYHFSGRVNGFSNYAGQTWSPTPKSKPGKLVNVASLMIDYCLNGKRQTKAELTQKVTYFSEELQSTSDSIQANAKAPTN